MLPEELISNCGDRSVDVGKESLITDTDSPSNSNDFALQIVGSKRINSVIISTTTVPSSALEGDRQWECPICFTEQDEIGWRCKAGHRYCSSCMQQHIASSPMPKCPTIGCSNALAEADLKLLGISQDVLEAFRNRKLQGAINMLGASETECDETALFFAIAIVRDGETTIKI